MEAVDQDRCSVHGAPSKRSICDECNAAYMRAYLRHRRSTAPVKELWWRARKRAKRLGLEFDLDVSDLTIPANCPVLNIPLFIGQGRSPNSPSLDRIDPARGYVAGNVRVISDRANRLKSDYTLDDVRERSRVATDALRSDYLLLVDYLDREELLAIAATRSETQARDRRDWKRVVGLLTQVCTFGLQTSAMSTQPSVREV